jgi:DNA-binding NtrC family response regulator
MPGKFLIVDDEKSLRRSFSAFLAAAGHETAMAASFDEAVDLLAAREFDVVFSDILLGAQTGIDLLEEIKKRNLDCLVVMVTGYPSTETAVDAVRLGAFDYLAKPVLKDDLLKVARTALQVIRTERARIELQTHLEALMGSVRDGILTVDDHGGVLFMNRAGKELFGFPGIEKGMPTESLFGEVLPEALHLLSEAFRDRQPHDASRVSCQLATGKKVVSLFASPLINSLERAFGAVLVIRDETRLHSLERILEERQRFHNLIGRSAPMQEVYNLIEDLGDVATTTLIIGESGTGKELVAEALHYTGERRDKPLVKVNCAALSDTLLESELFGHVRGAFTGAVRDRVGRFKLADGGTIFLDEIGDISTRMQLQLLRVLQEKQFERLGESLPISVDIRVVAATNQDLLAKIKKGEFREDLYFRLKVVTISLPPLRDRREDIPQLVEHFRGLLNKTLHREVKEISPEVLTLFLEYSWPGNIRELGHSLEHAFIRCRNNREIHLEHLPPELKSFVPVCPSSNKLTPHFEKEKFITALGRAGWNKTKAARQLGIDRKTLYRKMKQLNIPEREECT